MTGGARHSEHILRIFEQISPAGRNDNDSELSAFASLREVIPIARCRKTTTRCSEMATRVAHRSLSQFRVSLEIVNEFKPPALVGRHVPTGLAIAL